MNTSWLMQQYRDGRRDFSGISIGNGACMRVVLSGADFTNARFYNCSFDFSDLSNCNFTGADLTSISLIGANLSCANFRKTKLRYANLSNANVIGADFTGAKLKNARLFRTHIEWAAISPPALKSAYTSPI